MIYIIRFILPAVLLVAVSAGYLGISLPADRLVEESDFPDSIRMSYVLEDAHTADSLASRGDVLEALGK